MDIRRRRIRSLAGAAAVLVSAGLQLSSPSFSADLKGFAWMCGDGKQLCYWHKAVVTPPKGWVEDEAWTKRYKAMVMFPNGDNSRSKPIMYVRAHNGDKALDLDTYVKVAQERWLKRLTDSTIEPLDDLVRPGKPTFKVFLYKNPSQPDQAFELTAFTKDVDNANPKETYFFQIVLAAPSRAQLDKAKGAFYDVMKRL